MKHICIKSCRAAKYVPCEIQLLKQAVHSVQTDRFDLCFLWLGNILKTIQISLPVLKSDPLFPLPVRPRYKVSCVPSMTEQLQTDPMVGRCE